MESNNIDENDINLFEINPMQLDNGPTRARENMEKHVCFFFSMLILFK